MIDYREAGVNREEGYRAVNAFAAHTGRTATGGVLGAMGSFASLFELTGYRAPVLVSGTDGVGTKLKIAFELGIYHTVGIDCVAMCVNDVLCHGAAPLFFLDYLACGSLVAEQAEGIVRGIADGCQEAGCALTGGETAEMPGFYQPGEYDVAGFCVGAVEKEHIIDGSGIAAGDILIGIDSSGVHSNGFSLVRKLVPNLRLPFQGRTIGEQLLTPTAIYVKPVLKLLKEVAVHGMSHITGGGLPENVPRMLPPGLEALVHKDSLPAPPVFGYLQDLGVAEEEMLHTFNMGTGFVLAVSPQDAGRTLELLKAEGAPARRIGFIREGGGGLCFA